MKIALCLSGQVRSFRHIKECLFDNFLNIHTPDIFCHFWYKAGNAKYENFFNPQCTCDYGNYGKYTIDEITNTLKPVSIKWETPFIPENTKSMLYSLKSCNELKIEHEINRDFEYDVVIRARLDLFYTAPLQFNNILDNNIYVINRPGGCGGVNDWFAYGSSKTINIYSNMYTDYKNTERIKQLCPEGIVDEHIRKNSLSLNYIDRTFYIVREDKTITT